MAPGGGFDGFGAGFAQNADGNGITLLFVFLEPEGHVVLKQAFVGDFEAFVVLLTFKENGGGGGELEEVVRGAIIIFVTGETMKALQDLAGSNCGGGEGNRST